MWDIRKSAGRTRTEKDEQLLLSAQSHEPSPYFSHKEEEAAPASPAGSPGHLLQVKVEIHQELLDRVNLAVLERYTRDELMREFAPLVEEILTERNLALNRFEKADLTEEIMDELVGLGPLEPLLQDDTISDILVNGYQTVFIERSEEHTSELQSH